MGDTVVSVAANTVPLFETHPESQKKDVMLSSVLKSKEITSELLQHQIGGLPGKYNRMVEFINRSPDLDLPFLWSEVGSRDWNNTVNFASSAQVEDVIETEIGEQIAIPNPVIVRPPTEDWISKWYLQENHAYSVSTNIVGNYPDPLDPKWEVTYVTASFRYSTDTYFEIEVTFSIRDTTAVDPTYQETKIFDISQFTLSSNLYNVEYYTLAQPSETIYWIYDIADNTYPQLNFESYGDDWDNGNQPQVVSPVVTFRQYGVSLSETNQPEQYEASKQALDLINVDYESILETLNQNPDIADIYHANLTFSVDPEDDSPAVTEYLWEHFNVLRGMSQDSRLSFEADFVFGPGNLDKDTAESIWTQNNTGSTATFRYRDLDYSYSTWTRFAFIEETFHKGTFTQAKEYFVNNTYEAADYGPYAGQTRNRRTQHLYLRKQIRPGLYSQLYIVNLRTRDQVYSPQGGSAVNHYSADWVALGGVGAPDNDSMRLPLLTPALNAMNNGLDKAQVLQGSMGILVYGLDVQKLAWYETGVFRGLLIIAAIFISAATLQPEFAAIAAAATIQAAVILTLSLVVDIIIFKLIIDYAIRFLVKEFDLETTFWIILVATVTAAVTGNLDFVGLNNMPWADQLLRAATTALDSLGELTSDALDDIFRETTEFLQTAEERQEEIEEANDLLSNNYDPFSIVNPNRNIILNEPPTQYYERTIHNTNPGVLSLDAVSDYVDNALRLPDINNMHLL